MNIQKSVIGPSTIPAEILWMCSVILHFREMQHFFLIRLMQCARKLWEWFCANYYFHNFCDSNIKSTCFINRSNIWVSWAELQKHLIFICHHPIKYYDKPLISTRNKTLLSNSEIPSHQVFYVFCTKKEWRCTMYIQAEKTRLRL